MDPQSNALYDIESFQQHFELKQVPTTNSNSSEDKTAKPKNNTRKCTIVLNQPTDEIRNECKNEHLTPSSSFCRVKRHHGLTLGNAWNCSMCGEIKSHQISFSNGSGESNLASSSPNMLLGISRHFTASHLSRTGSYVFSENLSGKMCKLDNYASVKSIASIGMGSTDGRKMFIRKVPHTAELINYLNAPT